MDYSVVIPCFNSNATILAAIDSVMAQSILPREIFVVDDASTDNTIEIVERLNNPLIHIIAFEKNKGVSAARNSGWDHAMSEYVAFLDSDDIWHPQKIAMITQYLPAMQSPVICHEFTYSEMPHIALSSKLDYYAIRSIRFRSFLLHNEVVSCSVIVHRSFPLRYDESMRYCEDHDFLLRSSYITPIPQLRYPLAQVGRTINSHGGLSGNLWKMRLGEMKMYLKLYLINIPLIILTLPLLLYSMMKHVRMMVLPKK